MTDPTPIDITNLPELTRIAEEVKVTKTPRELRRDNKPIALITPIAQATPQRRKRGKITVDAEAFKATAGSLKGLIDAEQLKKDIYESRGLITRPPIKL